MWDSIYQFFFGPEAQQWNVAAGILSGLIALLLLVWGVLAGIAKFFRKEKPVEFVDVTPKEEKPDPFPNAPFLNVPTIPRAVKGRDDELSELEGILNDTGEAAIVNSGAVLKGQGGIGKTTLALEFAYRHRGEYAGILWANAENETSLAEDIHLLCPSLDMDIPQPMNPTTAATVIGRLEQTGQPWLLIFDNVPEFATIQKLAPSTGGCVKLIVTTREATGWAGFGVMQTDILDFSTPDSAAVQVLMDEAGREKDAEGARDLAEVLDGLPLALVIAGGLIRREGLGFRDYLDQVERIIAEAPKNEAYPDSVIGAVALSFGKLSKDAQFVGGLFSWWAPEGLEARLITDPREILAGEATENGEDPDSEQATEPVDVPAAIAELEDRSLIKAAGDGTYSMHRMTAAALRALQGENGLGEMAAGLLATVYPNPVSVSANWPTCRRLTPHVRALWATGAAPAIAHMDFLLNQAAIFLGTTGDFAGGADLARASLDQKTARLPEGDRAVAVGHANLGKRLLALGDFEGSERELARAVALHEQHRPESQELAGSLDLMGGVLLAIGRAGDRAALVRSLRARQQAAALLRRLVPRQSDERAQVLNNLATVRFVLGQGAAALRLYEAALSIRRQVLPESDARLGYSLLNVGAMSLRNGAADRAECLLEKALQIRQQAYIENPRHPEIVNAASFFVSCLLTRARAGENTGMREMRARQLCDEFGFDFEEEKRKAEQYPYAAENG